MYVPQPCCSCIVADAVCKEGPAYPAFVFRLIVVCLWSLMSDLKRNVCFFLCPLSWEVCCCLETAQVASWGGILCPELHRKNVHDLECSFASHPHKNRQWFLKIIHGTCSCAVRWSHGHKQNSVRLHGNKCPFSNNSDWPSPGPVTLETIFMSRSIGCDLTFVVVSL